MQFHDPIHSRLEAHGIVQADGSLVDAIAGRLRAHGIDPDALQPPAGDQVAQFSDILADRDFWKMSPGDQLSVRRKFYQLLTRDLDYQKLSPEDRHDVAKAVLGEPSTRVEPGAAKKHTHLTTSVFERQLAAEEALFRHRPLIRIRSKN